MFHLAKSPCHVNDNNGCDRRWNETIEIEGMTEGMGNGLVSSWSVVILMNTMIYYGSTKVLMTLAALEFDGLEAIAPCDLNFYLSLKINDVFGFDASLLSSR